MNETEQEDFKPRITRRHRGLGHNITAISVDPGMR